MEHLLLEPLKYYTSVKEKHRDLVNSYFEKLYIQSGVDGAANERTVAAYHRQQQLLAELGERRMRYKIFRVLSIIAAILCAVAAVLILNNGIWWGLFGFLFTAGFVLLWIRKLNPLIRKAADSYAKAEAEAARLLAEANAQMAPLNALFDNTDLHRLIEQVMPEVKFHYSLLPAHFEMLRDCDYSELFDECNSILDTTAGTLCENPFLFLRYQTQTMRDRIYQGHLSISWSERVRDSNGHYRTVHRSQTLTASVSRPVPSYENTTCLLYGAQSAPELFFSRHGTHVEDLSERALRRRIENGTEDLQKKARKATQKGGNFQEMANNEFEVLFGAHNRTNEVQFRVMYTPLAQENTTALLLDEKEGWGDDFHFIKNRRCNIIRSEHAQSWDMNTGPHHYRSYSLAEARAKFEARNVDYFRSVFFDFAPLLAVPSYQDSPAVSLSGAPRTDRNSTDYEYEVVANMLGINHFAHPNTAPEGGVTLKAKFLRREGDTDYANIMAYSFYTERRVTYVPVFGGDGRTHDVPVYWTEYLPLMQKRTIGVRRMDISDRTFLEQKSASLPQTWVFYRGLLGFFNT